MNNIVSKDTTFNLFTWLTFSFDEWECFSQDAGPSWRLNATSSHIGAQVLILAVFSPGHPKKTKQKTNTRMSLISLDLKVRVVNSKWMTATISQMTLSYQASIPFGSLTMRLAQLIATLTLSVRRSVTKKKKKKQSLTVHLFILCTTQEEKTLVRCSLRSSIEPQKRYSQLWLLWYFSCHLNSFIETWNDDNISFLSKVPNIGYKR